MVNKTQLIAIDKVNSHQSIIGISLLMKLIESYAHDANTILEKAGIQANLLADPKATVSFQQEIAFTRALINTITDKDLGFKVGQCYRLNAFGHIGLAAGSCNTVADAIELFLKYIRLAYTHFDISFFKQSGNAVLRFSDKYALDELRQFYLERDFSFAFLSTRDMFPRSVVGQKPKTIHFDFACPTSVEHYESLYECPVKFSMPFSEILFDERYLDLPLPLANPLTRELLEEQCKQQEIALFGAECIDSKIRLLIQNMEYEMPNLEDIAKKYFITARTLRRKLKEQGVTFQQIANEELSKKALYYLSTTNLSIEQISLRLGYSESASFIHAFKRWTGTTPKQYR
ncbi:MAG: AraC family transcriptional regulator [Colwellia sp.]|nr:AraC family transcriptional regulator [Colwellia sp.]